MWLNNEENWTDIPKEFYPFESDAPFNKCVQCEVDLIGTKQHYIVERALKGNDVLFEYAMCMPCVQKMRATFSKESLQKLEDYMSAHRDDLLDLGDDTALEEKLSKCAITGLPVQYLKEYQLCGMFMGDKMMGGPFPYIIAGDVMDEMQELISPETREELDNFIDENFGLPPEWKELIKEKDVILL